MTIAPNVFRAVYEGVLPGNERWAAGFWGRNGDTPPSAQDIADELHADLIASPLLGYAQKMMGLGSGFERVRVYAYGAGGSLVGTAASTSTGFGGTGSQIHPNQSAACITIRTEHAGRSGRGRIYWPGTGLDIAQGTGLIQGNQLEDFVQGLAISAGGVGIGVMSQKTGGFYPATRLEADRVMDSQNGRRRSLISSYVGSDI